jgi:hypothetical protein
VKRGAPGPSRARARVPKLVRQPILGILEPPGQRPPQVLHPDGSDETVFPHETPDLVRLGRPLADQSLADPVRGLAVLLRHALDRHETHAGASHRFADCFRIDTIVLVALHVRLHELRRDELHSKTSLLKLACPVVG